jgi:hypothetical protein
MADRIAADYINVSGDPARARETVAAALAARGFTLNWADEWNGAATKGSRLKQALLGAFAVYLVVNVSILARDGMTVIMLSRPSTGISGGLAGRARAQRQFASLVAELTEVFRANGVLL